jgi:hypothetical protein
VHKRLERGTFAFMRDITPNAKCVLIDVHELEMLLEGIDVKRGRIAKRWEPPLACDSIEMILGDPT